MKKSKIVLQILAVLSVLILAVCMFFASPAETQKTTTDPGGTTPSDVAMAKVTIEIPDGQICGIGICYANTADAIKEDLTIEVSANGQKIKSFTNSDYSSRNGSFFYYYLNSTVPCDECEILISSTSSTQLLATDDGTVRAVAVTDRVAPIFFVLIPCAIFAAFFLLWGIAHLLKRKFSFDKFTVVYVILLAIWFTATPLMTVSDEQDHFLRAYTISKGAIIAEQIGDNAVGGGYVPAYIAEFANLHTDNLLHTGNIRSAAELNELAYKAGDATVEITFPNTAINPATIYLPQALGIAIGRLFGASPSALMYLGRFFNCIAAAFLILLAIKTTPVGKEYFKIVSLFPMAMNEAVSMAPDMLIFGILMLFAAQILRLRYTDRKLETKDLISLYLLTALAVTSKPVYAPFVLLLFLIPPKKFGEKKTYIANIAVASVLIVVLALSWYLVTNIYNLHFNASDSALQIAFNLKKPATFIVALTDFISHSFAWLLGAIGVRLGYMNITVNNWVQFAILLTLFRIVINQKQTLKDIPVKAIVFAATFISFMLILISEYLHWTAVGATAIDGIQGRYFIQLIPLFLLALKTDKKDTALEPELQDKIYGVAILGNLYSIAMYSLATLF